MKLLLLLLTFVLGMGNISSDSENRSDESLLVNVKVTLSDGTVENFNGTYKESLIFTNGFEEILACTYVTPSGECESTGATCDEALEELSDCLCEEGYDNWCGNEPLQPDE